jgi:hypothetical protein
LIYKAFLAWKNGVANSSSGVIMSDGAANPLRVPVTVWATDGNGVKISGFGQWDFKGCFVQEVGEVSFDVTSGDPITCSITMGFMKIDDTLL